MRMYRIRIDTDDPMAEPDGAIRVAVTRMSEILPTGDYPLTITATDTTGTVVSRHHYQPPQGEPT